MPSAIQTFNDRVAARTRTADQILKNKELLALYEDQGGLRSDLEEIRKHGLAAEALSQAKSGAKAAGGSATLAVLESFADLQKEYSAVMAVVQAVRKDLEDQGTGPEVQKAVDQILVNEAQVLLKPVAPKDLKKAGADGEAPAKPKRRASRSLSQEALRAEIQKDATALLDLKGASAALTKRKVTPARLKKLQDAAKDLASALGERSAQKGAAKAATQAVRDAVSAQKRAWGACYRILAAVGQADERVQQLLAEAARSR